MSSTTLPSLHALLIEEIKDLFYAENLLLKALPKMARAATNTKLKAAFTGHLAQTRGHVKRLKQSLHLLDLAPKGRVCHAMLGLLKEGAEAIKATGPAAVRDAALIGAAQRVEHYEMAGYGTAHAFAQALGEGSIAGLLQQTLDEEGEADQKLTTISAMVNADAIAASDPVPSTNRR